MRIELPLNPQPLPPIDCDIIASIAVDPRVVAQMDLMMGIHPEEKRELTEQEEDASGLVSRLARNTQLSKTDDFSRSLALWRENWPGWEATTEGRRSYRKNAKERWRFLMPYCKPIAAAYLFSAAGPQPSAVRFRQENQYRAVFRDLQQRALLGPHSTDRITWTFSIPLSGGLDKDLFEQLCGLTSAAKSRLGLDGRNPGFLSHYATALEAPIDELLDPRQFEHLVADIFRAEGWGCRITPYSKDGGFDIEAYRTRDGVPTILLIEAKCNRSVSRQRRQTRPVGIAEVRAFAATIRAEGHSSGVLVTSSRITRDARDWAATKGRRVASVDFLEGSEIRDRLIAIYRRQAPGDAAAYIVDVTSR